MLDVIDERYTLFTENAQLLFNRFGIKPLLYGSLGLEVLLRKDLQSDDIDILIPGEMLNEKWGDFKTLLEKQGYILTDLHEHTFVKEGVKYSYACIEELADFAGIASFEEKGFCLFLTLRDYLNVYEASLLDGYRQTKKNNRDIEKIKIIKNAIQSMSQG